MTTKTKTGLLVGLAGAAFSFAAPAIAQEQQPIAETITTADEIVVPGEIVYRDRSDTTAPVLEYGSDYFQPFEPLTVGDALKRVPSVAFLSDVIESDGVRLRGLDPAYTQILINGDQIPGSGNSSGAFGNGAEQAFFVDRIPAELIERIEIVRSASASRSGDAVAGAINIVMRDSYSLDGGIVRLGSIRWDDGRVGGAFGGVLGSEALGGRLLLGANVQDRHNPKRKRSLRFAAPGAPIDNIELQSDDRDGTDYSFNFAYESEVGPGKLKLDGVFVRTDRYEDEDSVEANNPATFQNSQVSTLNNNDNAIDQQSLALGAAYNFDMLGGETKIKYSYANFQNNNSEFEDETEFLRDSVIFPEADRYTGEAATGQLEDDEYKLKLAHKRDLGGFDLEAGFQGEIKRRDSLFRSTTSGAQFNTTAATRVRVNLPAGTISTVARPAGQTGPAATAVITTPGGDNTIERRRLDTYVQADGKVGAISWEAGLRYEVTELEITDRTVAGPRRETDFQELLPSLHFKYDLTENDRLSVSLARTVRNPSFGFLSPATLLAELGDNDFRGNPALEQEKAWGLDAGYERRLGRLGVAGVNFFYRDIQDVIEVFSTGAVGSRGAGTLVYSARNSGDGEVYGVEFDLSTPLTFVGLKNTGVFLNYSYLDSQIRDEFGERTFNSQAEYVFNVGFIQDLPSWGAAFGATYRKQGDAFSRVVGEEVITEYGADLEMFIEKQFGKRFTMRLTGSNLLNGEKKEFFNKFNTAADQRTRTFDEYEVEIEDAGSVVQLVGRLAF